MKNKPLKFARRVALVGRYGVIRYVGAREGARLLAGGGVIHNEKTGRMVKELTIPASDHLRDPSRGNSNSLISGYRETLNGGSILQIETPVTLAREVTTEPCRTYKLKPIRKVDRDIYRRAVTDNLAPFKPEYARL